MATITVAPIVLKDALLIVGADNYEAHVSSVKFTPSASVATAKGLTPSAVFTDMGAPTWVCDMRLFQDWSTANSLSQYLLANAGQQKQVVFKPKKGAAGSMPTVTATLIIAPPEIGGDVDAWLETTVQHGVSGVPVLSTT